MSKKDVWNHVVYVAVICLLYLAGRVALVTSLGMDEAQFLLVAATSLLSGLVAILYLKICLGK